MNRTLIGSTAPPGEDTFHWYLQDGAGVGVIPEVVVEGGSGRIELISFTPAP